MEKIECQHCGSLIPAERHICPFCNRICKKNELKMVTKILLLFAGIFIVIAIVMFLFTL